MKELFLIIIATVLANNFVLTRFLGLCPFMGVSRKLETAIGMAFATMFVLTLSSVANFVVEVWILQPLGLAYLRIIAFILIIAGIVQITELMVHKVNPLLYQVLGIYLPLVATNCAVLGVALLNVQKSSNFIEALFAGFGAAAGFALVMILFAALRERIDVSDVPAPFKGAAIALITAGLMSLAFMGFSGFAEF